VVLAVDDVDLNEDQFLSSTATPDGQTVGAMAFVNGAWTYTVANAAIESLGSGAVTDNTGTTITNGSLTESFTVTSLDETDDATIEVTVNGTNDAAVIADDTNVGGNGLVGTVTESTDPNLTERCP
jgi:VCBS repeat-containing protein